MPTSEEVAANKAKSQARKLIAALQLRGHKRIDIANALGVPASKLTNIMKGAVVGADLEAGLRDLLAKGLPKPATDTGAGAASVTDAAADATPAVSPEPMCGPLPVDLREVEAPTNTPARAPGLGERLKSLMLGSGDAGADARVTLPPIARASGGKGKGDLQTQFIAQVLPVLALCVAWGSEMAIRDPYKPVAPTVEEASAMLAVPIRRVAQQLDIRGRLTENTMDGLMMLLAVAAYGKRARATYTTIRERETHEHNEQTTARGASGPGADGARTHASGNGSHTASFPDVQRAGSGPHPGAAAARDVSAGGRAADSGGAGWRGLFGGGSHRPDDERDAPQPDRIVHGANTGQPASATGDAPDPMAELLRADYEGRLRLGLLG